MAINRKTGYIQKQKPNKSKTFESKWGEPAYKIAQREDVAVATIHMRVFNYGSPYQRTSKPSISEVLCGKTLYQLGEELNLHPITVQQRIRAHNNPYISMRGIEKEFSTHNFSKKKGRKDIWLMPEHPCHAEWVEMKAKKDAELKQAKGVKHAEQNNIS